MGAPWVRFGPSTAASTSASPAMSNEKISEAPDQATRGGADVTTEQPHLEMVASIAMEQEKASHLSHVEALGLDDAEALKKKIVRRLDMTMLPQLWVLYMFNYLNRNNIAQARLNTFNEDLSLKDGDYQVNHLQVC